MYTVITQIFFRKCVTGAFFTRYSVNHVGWQSVRFSFVVTRKNVIAIRIICDFVTVPTYTACFYSFPIYRIQLCGTNEFLDWQTNYNWYLWETWVWYAQMRTRHRFFVWSGLVSLSLYLINQSSIVRNQLSSIPRALGNNWVTYPVRLFYGNCVPGFSSGWGLNECKNGP